MQNLYFGLIDKDDKYWVAHEVARVDLLLTAVEAISDKKMIASIHIG